jgi:hypothetical protein
MVEAKPWAKVKNEQLSEVISRQMVSGEEATLARILLTRGAVVPRRRRLFAAWRNEGVRAWTWD